MRWVLRQEPAAGGGSLTTPPPDRPSVLHVPAVECTAGALADLDAAGEVREVPVPPGDTAALARHLRVPVGGLAPTGLLRNPEVRQLLVIK